MRLLLPRALALSLAVLVAGCWPDDGPDYHGETPDPADLTVRQSPNDTVRLGETVTFTAVFRDSLNPKWQYFWALCDNCVASVGGRERTIHWAPADTGLYRGRVYVNSMNTRSNRYFQTIVVLP